MSDDNFAKIIYSYKLCPQKSSSYKWLTGSSIRLCNLNPSIPDAPFRYKLKRSGNQKIFSCFQGLEKGCIGNKEVNKDKHKFYVRIFLRFFNSLSVKEAYIKHNLQIFWVTPGKYNFSRETLNESKSSNLQCLTILKCQHLLFTCD